MLNLQTSEKLIINLRNEYGAVLRLSCLPVARRVNEYSIKYINSDYTLNNEDFYGFSIVLVTAVATVTIPVVGIKVTVGRCVNIGQETDGTVSIVPSDGVTIHPIDACLLRRDGSFATLIYEGSDRWRFIGELP